MLDTSETQIKQLILHRVGNKFRSEGISLSPDLHPITDDLEKVLLNYYLVPLQSKEHYKFSHSSDTALNEMYSFTRAIFAGRTPFIGVSEKAAKHLYSICVHPQIKGGEVSFVLFENVRFEGAKTSAWGIFKSERKDVFLSIEERKNQLSMRLSRGIPTKTFDKGCLIVNANSEDGFRVISIDMNKDESRFWHEDFLGLSPVEDDRHKTESCLSMCTQFVEQQFSGGENRKDKILTLQKALTYFDTSEVFETEAFARTVLGDEKASADFKQFKKNFDKESVVPTGNKFPIFKPAVKKVKKTLKRNIRLDTQMEVTLKFNDAEKQNAFVERGYDAKRKMHYYKLYFNKES